MVNTIHHGTKFVLKELILRRVNHREQCFVSEDTAGLGLFQKADPPE
jgi:hypothetical protein